MVSVLCGEIGNVCGNSNQFGCIRGRRRRSLQAIPHAIAKHGLNGEEWSINDEALLLLICRHTREAGAEATRLTHSGHRPDRHSPIIARYGILL